MMRADDGWRRAWAIVAAQGAVIAVVLLVLSMFR